MTCSKWQLSANGPMQRTRLERIWVKLSSRRARMAGRSFSFVSTISRTKKMTSSAEAVLVSPRKSMSSWMTEPATSGNFTALRRKTMGDVQTGVGSLASKQGDWSPMLLYLHESP